MSLQGARRRLLLRYIRCAGGMVFLLCMGCGSLSGGQEPQRPTPANPTWSAEEVRGHLRVFNSPTAGDRGTGTEGFASTAAYLVARMREFNLQPTLRNDFRLIYQTPLHRVQGSLVRVAGTDTTRIAPGPGFQIDGRSAGGTFFTAEIQWLPAVLSVDSIQTLHLAKAVAMPAVMGTDAMLRSLRDQGVRFVILVGRRTLKAYTQPIEKLLVVQLSTTLWEQLLSVVGTMEQVYNRAEVQHLRFAQTVGARIEAQTFSRAGAMNMMGYVAGKHPDLADELVIVCADLDALPAATGSGPDELGVGAAALMEVARQIGYFSRYWMVPERTVLFAVWSGSHTNHAGLREYLARPLWPLPQTRTLIYAGLRPSAYEEVRALTDAAGIRLIVADRSAPADTVAVPPAPASLEAAVQQEVPAAVELAETLYGYIFQEALSPRAVPALTDSLLVPPAQ